MAGEIFAGIGAFNSMLSIVKTLKDMGEASARDKAVYDLREQILSAQERYSAALQKIGTLEKELADHETWTREKQRYDLKNIGYGAFAYMLKPAERGMSPPHFVCTNCYEHKHIAIIQLVMEPGKGQTWRCPSCKSKIDPGVGLAKWLD